MVGSRSAAVRGGQGRGRTADLPFSGGRSYQLSYLADAPPDHGGRLGERNHTGAAAGGHENGTHDRIPLCCPGVPAPIV